MLFVDVIEFAVLLQADEHIGSCLVIPTVNLELIDVVGRMNILHAL